VKGKLALDISRFGQRTDGRDGGDDLSELELIQDGSFTGGIESDHENSCYKLVEEWENGTDVVSPSSERW
jgi:hypothetical protein